MGLERDYQIDILSKQFKYYSVYHYALKEGILNPNFITGFTDAEGCFFIALKKSVGGGAAKLGETV